MPNANTSSLNICNTSGTICHKKQETAKKRILTEFQWLY